MANSNFDPQTFLDSTLTKPTEKRSPLPVGEYMAVIGEVAARAWAKGDKSGIALDVPLTLEVPAAIQADFQLPPTLMQKDTIFLDVTSEGWIDNAPGKNRKLRTYREALGLNDKKSVFSARLMAGKVVTVKITHEIYEGLPVERIGGIIRTA